MPGVRGVTCHVWCVMCDVLCVCVMNVMNVMNVMCTVCIPLAWDRPCACVRVRMPMYVDVWICGCLRDVCDECVLCLRGVCVIHV